MGGAPAPFRQEEGRVIAVDQFILARLAVPDDMAPLDATAAMWVKNTVTDAVRLPAAGRRELLQLVRSLPQEERCSGLASGTRRRWNGC